MEYKNIEPLLKAVDTACWALAVKSSTKRGQSCKVDWKGALVDLQDAWGLFQITNSGEIVISEQPPQPAVGQE